MIDRRQFLLGASSTALALSEVLSLPVTAAEALPTLRQAAQKRGIEIGAFVATGQLYDPAYTQMLGENFTLVANLFTEMEWDDNPGFDREPSFSDLTAFLDKCREIGVRPRARQIYSREALPHGAHLRADGTPKNKSELEKTLLKRVEQVCKPLKGRNAIIQVIDEILADHDGGLRKDPFSNALGEEYVDLLFHATHEAVPDALLTYQEFGPEYGPNYYFKLKNREYLELLERLRKRGVPITGAAVGGFMHPDLVLDTAYFKRIEALDYDIHLNELTQIYKIRGEPESEAWLPKSPKENDRIVAQRYNNYVKFFANLKRVREISFFAAVDGRNTIETGTLSVEPVANARPGIFNYDLTPKPVYRSLVDTVLKSKPKV